MLIEIDKASIATHRVFGGRPSCKVVAFIHTIPLGITAGRMGRGGRGNKPGGNGGKPVDSGDGPWSEWHLCKN
jgi:hypothetical protein